MKKERQNVQKRIYVGRIAGTLNFASSLGFKGSGEKDKCILPVLHESYIFSMAITVSDQWRSKNKIAGGGHGNPPQYSSWRIPWTEKSGRLQAIGSQRVRHDEVP